MRWLNSRNNTWLGRAILPPINCCIGVGLYYHMFQSSVTIYFPTIHGDDETDATFHVMLNVLWDLVNFGDHT